MKYLEFTIKDYKGVKNTTLDLKGKIEPGIYTLVGLNESGKTTILDAIKHLRNGTDTSVINASSLIPRRKRSSFTGKVKVSAKLSFGDRDKINLEKAIITLPYKNISILSDEVVFTRFYHYIKSSYSGEEIFVDIKVWDRKKIQVKIQRNSFLSG